MQTIRERVVLAGLMVAVACAWMGFSYFIAAVDQRARQETRQILETEQQRRLLAQWVEGGYVWVIKTTDSGRGLPYMHEAAVFEEEDLVACEDRRREWLAYKAEAARVIGPHYVVTVSHCRHAFVRVGARNEWLTSLTSMRPAE